MVALDLPVMILSVVQLICAESGSASKLTAVAVMLGAFMLHVLWLHSLSNG